LAGGEAELLQAFVDLDPDDGTRDAPNCLPVFRMVDASTADALDGHPISLVQARWEIHGPSGGLQIMRVLSQFLLIGESVPIFLLIDESTLTSYSPSRSPLA